MTATRAALLFPIVALGFASACGDPTSPFPQAPRDVVPAASISDGNNNGGNEHFYWLRPMVTPPATFPGTFDDTQAPTVEICEWDGAACVNVLATFSTASGSGSEIVRVESANEHYIVNWHTNDAGLDATKIYRVRVLVGSYELGYADVDPVSNGRQLKNVNTGEDIALVDGKTLPITFRIEQGAVTDVQPVAAGGYHTCALDPAGMAYCWGYNLQGQLGTGTPTTSSPYGVATPQVVTGGLTFNAIAAGVLHTCALTSAGAAHCWGDNTTGQLGTGMIGGSQATPQLVAAAPQFRVITAGEAHTCGLTTAGVAYCWGNNGHGQLGTGSTSPIFVPTPTPVPGLTFTMLSAGERHTCGVATNGTTYCWGWNHYGQLGDITVADTPTPQPVSSSTAFVSVHAGGEHTCALDAARGAWCWGSNLSGNLGLGTFTVFQSPGLVSGGVQLVRLSTGGSHTCGLTTSGTAHCWGNNFVGQLGLGSYSPGVPAPTAVPTLTFSSLSAGLSHTCGILTDGRGRCWGNNVRGGLGTGSMTDPFAASPQPVAGVTTFMMP